MPFAPLRDPSIALSLLKASVPDVTARVLYLNLAFAERYGVELYQLVANGLPGPCLPGEWLFSRALHDEAPHSIEAYMDDILDPAAGDRLTVDSRRDFLAAAASIDDFVTDCVATIEALEPRIVGFSSVFQQHAPALALARALARRNPDLFILFGGANVEGVMGLETIRSFRFVDASVSGEADLVFPRIVERVLAGEPVDDLDGVITSANLELRAADERLTAPRTAAMDDLPYPDYDDFFDQWYGSSLAAAMTARLVYETSRGCWWGEKQHCTFCGINGASMAFRSKSSERAMEELLHLIDTYPGHPLMVVDTILNMRFFDDFLPRLAETGLDLKLFYETKANLRKDQIELLQAAGVTEIQPGIESLSDPVLAEMRKGVSALQNVQLLKWCATIGVWPSWYFLWGFPNEDPDEYRKMAALIPHLSHLPPPMVGTPIHLVRWSPNLERSEEMGFVDVRPAPAYRHVYGLDEAALENLAYYFAFRYGDGRDITGYTAPLVAAIERWREVYEESELFSVEREDELWVWDLRPGAIQPLTALEGAERRLYLDCDQIRTLAWLGEHSLALPDRAATREEVLAVVEPLVVRGFAVRDGERVLALALPRGESVPQRARAKAATSSG